MKLRKHDGVPTARPRARGSAWATPRSFSKSALFGLPFGGRPATIVRAPAPQAYRPNVQTLPPGAIRGKSAVAIFDDFWFSWDETRNLEPPPAPSGDPVEDFRRLVAWGLAPHETVVDAVLSLLPPELGRASSPSPCVGSAGTSSWSTASMGPRSPPSSSSTAPAWSPRSGPPAGP